jgi:arginyl-tRNA synthetase
MKKSVMNTVSKILAQEVVLERPKDKSHGHFSTPVAFSLAKEYKKSPMIIAEELVEQFEAEHIFERVSALKGFINFTLSESFLDEFATQVIKDEDEFGKAEAKEEKILLEYVSANPTGPLHIGHARGAIVGDVLYRLGTHLGYQIDTEYYVNDAGNQIRLLGISLQLAAKSEIFNQSVEYPEEYYKGEYITDLAKEIHDESGDEIFSDEKFDELALMGKDKMLELIKQNLKEAGIEFKNYVSEKALYDQWDGIQAKLESNEALYKKEEKLWLKSSEHGDELDRVVVRENGIPTYLAGDIIYHNDKFARGYDSYINIWGADHHGYIARVKSAIKYLGYDESRLEVMLAQMVALLKDGEPYKMSKRAGNFILMSDVVEDIGTDALRLVFLSKKIDTHLEFDISELNRHDASNPIFYINYAHARVNSLLEKSGKSREQIIASKLENLNGEAKTLIFDALLLPNVLEDAFKGRAVNKVADYLKALAATIHSFYNNNKVVGAENELQLLKTLLLAQTTIRVGLKLLGITAKDKM